MTLSLEEISARLEIDDLYARYIHAVDDKEFEPLDRIFLPETVFDWSASGGQRTTWEEAKHCDFLTGELFQFVFHLCGNLRMDFAPDLSSAVVKSKTIPPTGLRTPEGEAMLFQVHGAYTDQLKNTPDGWRITERVWQDFWVAGQVQEYEGIPGMLAEAGVHVEQQ